MSFYDLLGILIALVVVIIAYFKYKFSYLKRKGLYHPEPSIPFGNAYKCFAQKESHSAICANLYNELKKRNLKHGGCYFLTKPFYVPRDWDIIKGILVSDFQHFHGHGLYVNEEVDPLTGQLFSLNGDKWRKLRNKVTPTFTSGKMKMMFDTMAECSVALKRLLEENCGEKQTDLKDILQKYGAQIIGSCAFGIDTNTIKQEGSEILMQCQKFFNTDTIGSIRNITQFVLPRKVLDYIEFKTINPELTSYFLNIIRTITDYREKNNVYRKDFMHMMLQLKNRGDLADDGKVLDEDGKSKEVGLTFKQLCAQSFAFFVAGFETTSTTMMFTLYQLTKNPGVLEKLREEILEVLKKHDNKLSYDAVQEMQYLDLVLKEALRMHPPIPALIRSCNKDYLVPGTDVVIDEGTFVVIPSLAIHMDEDHYKNPEEFKPERFLEKDRHSCAWLPFGDGPRACLGLRFGILQAKVGLITILKDFDFALGDKTKEPLEYTANPIILENIGGVWLNFKKRS